MCDKVVQNNRVGYEKKIPDIRKSEAPKTQNRESLLKRVDVAFEGKHDVSEERSLSIKRLWEITLKHQSDFFLTRYSFDSSKAKI